MENDYRYYIEMFYSDVMTRLRGLMKDSCYNDSELDGMYWELKKFRYDDDGDVDYRKVYRIMRNVNDKWKERLRELSYGDEEYCDVV